PASGSFVSLSQATLMDAEPLGREQNMLRWTAAGSLGAVAGPLALGGVILLHLGWRSLFAAFAVLTIPVVIMLWARLPETRGAVEGQPLLNGLRAALRELRRGRVLRWLVMLECSDLLLDVLLGYLG